MHRLPRLLLFAIAAFAASAWTSAGAQVGPAKPKEWKLSVAVGPAFALGKAGEEWAKLVSERSAGALPVALYPGATLAQRDPDREFLALRAGAADLAVGSTLHWAAQVDELAVAGLPWIAPEPRELAALTTGAMRDRLFAAIERAGAVPLALAPLGHRAIATMGVPMRTPDELAGLNVRITATPYLVDLYAGLRALPQGMPFAAAADAFRSGRLDAQEGTAATFAATRLDGLGFRHVTLWGAVGEIAVFAANRAAWDGWSSDQRAWVKDAATSAARDLASEAAAEEAAALAALAQRGVTIMRLTGSGRAAFAFAARHTYDKWAAIAGDELARAAQSAVKAVAASPP